MFLKAKSFTARLLSKFKTSFGFWFSCFLYIHSKASKRYTEALLQFVMLSQVLRIAQAFNWIPLVPGFHSDSSMYTLVASVNVFYLSLWPSPLFWFYALILAVICSFLGLHQFVASLIMNHLGRDPRLLAPQGEDAEERFYLSVEPSWLRYDLYLRRLSMLIGKSFFALLSWIFLFKTGYGAILWIAVWYGCLRVDHSLSDIDRKIKNLVFERQEAINRAFKTVSAVIGDKKAIRMTESDFKLPPVVRIKEEKV